MTRSTLASCLAACALWSLATLATAQQPGGTGVVLPSQKFTPSVGTATPAANKPAPGPSYSADTLPNDMLRADPAAQAKLALSKGRAALAQGNTVAASFWHDKALQTGAVFGPNEDSPARLADDIRKAGGKISAPAAAQPQFGVPPEVANPAGIIPAAVPLPPTTLSTMMAPPGANPAGVPAALSAFPPIGNTAPAAAPPAAAPATAYPAATPAPTANDAQRNASNKLLVQARLSLAGGDVRRANEALTQAKALKVNYDFHEDSPAKVDAMLAKVAALQQRATTDRDSEGYRHRFAEVQMQQAEDLLRWNEFDEAERLVTEAKRLGISYGPYDAKPEGMLQRIAEARKGVRRPEPMPAVGAPAQLAAAPNASPAGAGVTPTMTGLPERTNRVRDLVKQARLAIQAGDLARAEKLAQEAESQRVPDTAFAPQDDRPFLVLLDLAKLRAGAMPASANIVPNQMANQAVYNPATDTTQNVPVNSQLQIVGQPKQGALPAGGQVGLGMSLFLEGEEALKQQDVPRAMAKFREAQKFAAELDPATRQRMQDLLQSGPANTAAKDSLIREASTNAQLIYKQVSADISRQEQVATQLRTTDPRKAAEMLSQSRQQVEKAPLEPATKELLLRRIDRSLEDLQNYIDVNRAKIELEQRNRSVMADIEREDRTKVEVDEKIALTVEEFNKLVDEQRFAEAEQVAKKLKLLAPNAPITAQVNKMAQVLRSVRTSDAIREETANNTSKAFIDVARAGIPMDTSNPILFPDAKEWKKMSGTRASLLAERKSRKTDRELEIEQRLRTPVSLKFKDAPLHEVITRLAELAQINMHLDPLGLGQEGVTNDTPVTIDLSQEISLKSALDLILEPLHLSYVIKNEVLKITSETLRDGEVYTVTYNVADLVVPIPNFVPNAKMGLPGAIDAAFNSMGQGGSQGNGGSMGPLSVVASNDGAATNATIDPRLLGQVNLGGGGGGMVPFAAGGRGGGATGFPQQIGFGPPSGAGGGAQPDFDQLIQLITGTISPTTWSDVGGAGAVRQFPTNLSLVISQTQQVHEEIADLLEQLRRLQDLQVTIEVRFINLADNFFEQMGVDFDFDLNDNIDRPGQIFGRFNPYTSTAYNATAPNTDYARDTLDRDLTSKTSATVGVTGAGVGSQTGPFSTDLDIPFRQSSFNQASLITTGTPGGVVAGGASLGFAILSDLEAYFFMNAVQNDIRTNVLQAPKVTLFNGQQAFVSDTAQTPFVISVVPVVGDFAAAQQPVIVVLSEGTFLTVQAVVSSDRRFVRLTVVPFFSRIGEVNTFTFTGSSSSTRTSNSTGPADDTTARNTTETNTADGTTVQLPTFAFTTVTTTVSVPDGGTVLLGGIKRLSEQRIENGVPVLSKLPYLNRLFTNVGTGRATSSLMMMVTPRIIIQEEEEALLGVQNTP